jgi:hypothetical protein
MTKISKCLLILMITPILGIADCEVEASHCYLTKLGFLEQQSKAISDDDYSHLTLNSLEIYKAKTDYISFIEDDVGIFKNKKYFMTKTIFTYTSNVSCHHEEYYGFCSYSVVLDFSGTKPILSDSFTPDSGNSVINWVSWGKKNAIIVFEDGSKFKYENSRVERVTGN